MSELKSLLAVQERDLALDAPLRRSAEDLAVGQVRLARARLPGTACDVDPQVGGLRKGEVARQLGLRHAPRLEFLIDTNLEQAQALTQLINTAVANDRRLEEGAAPGAESEAKSADGQ